MKSCRYCVVFLCALFSIAIGTGQTWLAEDNGQYTIYYVQEYEQDVEFVRTWMDHAEVLMLDKYGLQSHGYELAVYLHPAPTQYTDVGLATLNTSPSTNKGELHYLTPSAPVYGAGPKGGLRLSDDDYHAKTLIHEYITLGQERITREKPSRNYS